MIDVMDDTQISALDTQNLIYVVGHKNPDTDSIGAAIGYAWLIRERDGEPTVAARAGTINLQTKFALEYFNAPLPVLLEDASPRFESIAQRIEPLKPTQPLSEAWQLSARTRRAAPIVDEHCKPIGMVTGQSVFEFLSQRLDMPEALFGKLISVGCAKASDPNVPLFPVTDRISDHRESVFAPSAMTSG